MAISLSSGVRAALTSLQTNNTLAQVTQNRLATGKKVNSALDNPRSFFLAAGLNSRANDLSNLLDDVGQATKVLEAADKGLTALSKLIDQAKATLSTALQSASVTPKVTSSRTDITTSLSLNAAGQGTWAAADTLTIAYDGGAATTVFTADGTDTVADIISGINGNATLNPAGSPPRVAASVNSSGQLVIESLTGEEITVSGSAAAKVTTLFGATATLVQAELKNSVRTAQATVYGSLRTQIDQLSADASYNGINLLRGGSLKVVFNETATSSLTVAGVTYTAQGLGVDAAGNNLQSDTDIANAQADLDAAAITLRSQASSFGSNLSVVNNRQDFMKNIIGVLNTGADALTLADTNEEGANLLALNTRQQLSQTALSLAAQADQAVLRLFG